MPTHAATRGRFLLKTTLALLCAFSSLSCDGWPWDSDSHRPRLIGDGRSVDPESLLDPTIARSDKAVEALDDPRARYLGKASEHWRKHRGPERTVVDQVCLVPDVPSFFAAVAAWDEGRYFPILIDDPAWALPFLRAFRPARIVRFQMPPHGSFDPWPQALNAVSRAWVHESPGQTELPPAGAFPKHVGPTPPGVVLSYPESPTLAAAVALAAGRFQPLAHLEPMTADGSSRGDSLVLGFDHVTTEEQALDFARRVEARVAPLASSYMGLGDDLDFLTLAGEWPYRYRNETGKGIMYGDRALDDLVGRALPSGLYSYDPEKAMVRWAYTGRILGDPAAGLYRAMCALFLQPRSALLWNTYGGGRTWSDYDMAEAAKVLGVIRPGSGAIDSRAGDEADLASWHGAFRMNNRTDLFMINSSGNPRDFSIKGGPGRPVDLPIAPPAVVSMIHSFSAANPTDPSTIAGRFLDHGAFVYYGSMNEPYLTAFRTPYLIAQLIVAQTPLSAAFRQGPYERFGLPWRLIYLGDPLYHVRPLPPSRRSDRMSAQEWDQVGPGQSSPNLVVIDRAAPPTGADAAENLDWCRDAAMLWLCPDDATSTKGQVAVRAVLNLIDRNRLDPGRQAVFDELTIDQWTADRDFETLLDRLLRIDPKGRSARVWRVIETTAVSRLAELTQTGDFARVLDFWLDLIVRPWPPESDFPAHFTQKVGTAANAEGSTRLGPYRRRLAVAIHRLTSRNAAPARSESLVEELKRVEKALESPDSR